jgi:putative protease
LENGVEGEVILPIGELNRVRRALVFLLEKEAGVEVREVGWREVFGEGDQALRANGLDLRGGPRSHLAAEPRLSVLCRSDEQLEAALVGGVETIYLDFEDIRRYREAVARVRAFERVVRPAVFLATPRIQKAGEEGFFKLIVNAAPDGVLIRNLGAIDFFREQTQLRQIGDFSLNVANPLTAQHFMGLGLERCTVSYDLNLEQILALLAEAPAEWFELTLHQHMPMFHMEHCVFAAFMSKGSSYLDCGRPCEEHRVHLRDRVGMEHPLRADVGCRNTLFNATAQTGAQFYARLHEAGLRAFRLELLEENEASAAKLIRAYQGLLAGEESGEGLWRTLKANSQLGVTRGTL